MKAYLPERNQTSSDATATSTGVAMLIWGSKGAIKRTAIPAAPLRRKAEDFQLLRMKGGKFSTDSTSAGFPARNQSRNGA